MVRGKRSDVRIPHLERVSEPVNQNQVRAGASLLVSEIDVAEGDSSHQRVLANPFLLANPKAATFLRGLRIVEVGGIAAAFAGRLLGDLGAEVIKLEPLGGCPSRSDPHLFAFYNRGKRCIEIDARQLTGMDPRYDFLQSSDVSLLESGDPLDGPHRRELGSLAVSGLSICLSPFGHYAGRDQGSDLILQAAGGLVHVNGPADGTPLQGYGLQAYHSAGFNAVLALMLTLLGRREPRAKRIDVSIQASVVALMSQSLSRYQLTGEVTERPGKPDNLDFPIVRCADRAALASWRGDWTSLREWISAVGACSKLPTTPSRSELERTSTALSGFAASQTADSMVATAQALRLPFAVIRRASEIPQDPQLKARGCFSTPVAVLSPPLGSDAGWSPRSPDSPPRTAPPLAGLRVLDFTHHIAGPLVTRLLADHGAEVIKVEPVRSHGEPRDRGLFASLNRGKRSIAIDLHAGGAEVARILAARSDVVVDNFSPRVMANLGLDAATLRRGNPALITLSMSAFGSSGPDRDHVAYAPTLHARSGFTDLMTDPCSNSVGWGLSFSDYAAAHGASVLLLATLARGPAGHGTHIDFSQFENLIAWLGPGLLSALQGRAPARVGNSSQEMPAAPHGIFRCRDREDGRERWCALAVFDDCEWSRLASLLTSAGVRPDPRWEDASIRWHNRQTVERFLAAWLREQAAAAVVASLTTIGIRSAVVADAADLLGDPRIRSAGFWEATSSGWLADGYSYRLPDRGRLGRAPALGEHTEEILRELGLASECTPAGARHG